MNLWQYAIRKLPVINECETKVKLGYPWVVLYHRYVNMMSNRVIHVIGDSHVMPYKFQFPFIIHHLGQATAHNINDTESTNKTLSKLTKELKGIKATDVVMFVLGEIDARIHIYYQHRKTGRDIESIIYNTVQKYIDAVVSVRDGYGLKVAVSSLPPASTHIVNHFKYPFYGTVEQRRYIFEKMNEMLAVACYAEGIQFVDVSKWASVGGYMNKEFAMDDIHLNSRIVKYVRSALNEV